MPANSRWDLIRRLRVKGLNSAVGCTEEEKNYFALVPLRRYSGHGTPWRRQCSFGLINVDGIVKGWRKRRETETDKLTPPPSAPPQPLQK